jgi:tetrahydromethanopterin S-methyltransferase subunit C
VHVKVFALYTAARIGLFAVVYGVIWLIFGRWIEWNALSALYTAIIAMVISAVVAIWVLRGMREQLAVQVEQRASRAKSAFEARRSAEDDEQPR